MANSYNPIAKLEGGIQYSESFLNSISGKGGMGIGIGYGDGYGYGYGDGIGSGSGTGAGGQFSTNERGDLFLEDIEQSHHFTITIDKLFTFLPSYYRTKFEHSQYFLPVKSISFTKIAIENMSIPLGVLGSLPIMHRKNLGRLTMTLYDNHKEPIESAINAWIDSCFVSNDYVNYLSNIVGVMNYTSYDVTGKRNENVSGEYYVIPAESVTINRSYDANDAKLLDFSVVIIG